MKLPDSFRVSQIGVVVLFLAVALASCRHAPTTRPGSALSPFDRMVLGQYEQIRAALAADDPIQAHRAASDLVATVKTGGDAASRSPWVEPAQAVAAAQGLDGIRQRFKPLSQLAVRLAQGVDGYYVMTCDLPNAGDWVQRTPEVDDPYLGVAMHSLGNIKQ